MFFQETRGAHYIYVIIFNISNTSISYVYLLLKTSNHIKQAPDLIKKNNKYYQVICF
jgi:hypothetical protein